MALRRSLSLGDLSARILTAFADFLYQPLDSKLFRRFAAGFRGLANLGGADAAPNVKCSGKTKAAGQGTEHSTPEVQSHESPELRSVLWVEQPTRRDILRDSARSSSSNPPGLGRPARVWMGGTIKSYERVLSAISPPRKSSASAADQAGSLPHR